MGPVVTIVPATLEHAREMAPRLRAADAAEVLAAGGFDAYAAVAKSIEASGERAWAVRFDGELACCFGLVDVGQVLDPVGVIWLLGTDTLTRHPRAFVRTCREVLPFLQGEHRALVNMVDARYTAALRWLSALGFEVHPASPFGASGLPFHPVVRRSSVHV